MHGLIQKDLYSITGSLKSLLLVMVVFGIIFIPQSGGISFIAVTVFMMSALVISTISMDDFVKWDKYALTLPLSRKDIVKSKYELLIIFSVIGSVIGLGVSAAYNLIVKEASMADLLVMGIMMIAMSIALLSIVMPVIYKYGVEKARILMMVCIFLPIILILGLVYLAEDAGIAIPEMNEVLVIVSALLVSAAVFLLSYFVSLRIYSKIDL
ncbi:ABC-2 transporter permease [Candidatus Methanomassiliicoccus intestinalis]|jgi:putative ABC transporter, permease protein|uniref:Membrane protein n=2 Tax=Candidatus Methanomassiliicoccus intestinalis TaxID=1406512 RepID=R9T6Q0_METII|nr:ABC-2 transporter permease [Candidatus Methanomassiliicoccus intestinalis]AGN26269.1 membrane protein [Candidatus Methanomassiliicoccus intestinalis Issoire-Mx1]TQS84659.1 MAG: hypothetical protein A3207_01055 [Candidatus Methanomassiliicoccus intestinalis]